jgi:hypothetical protein
MSEAPEALTLLGAALKKGALLAGGAGTVLGIIVRRNFQWVEALSAASSGVCCVLFVAPAAARFFGFKGVEELESLASFSCGLLGMYIVDFVFALAKDPFGAWAKWRNGGKP